MSESVPVELIGGPHDNERVVLPAGSYEYRVEQAPKLLSIATIKHPEARLTTRTGIYRYHLPLTERLHGDDPATLIFVWRGWE